MPVYEECVNIGVDIPVMVVNRCKNGSRCSGTLDGPLAYGHTTQRIYADRLCAYCNEDTLRNHRYFKESQLLCLSGRYGTFLF